LAVIVMAPPSAASVALPGSEIVIVVDALLIVMVSCRVPLCGVPAESVETTFLTYVPAGVDADAVTTPLVMVTPVAEAESVYV
jgi:hypothetical protein